MSTRDWAIDFLIAGGAFLLGLIQMVLVSSTVLFSEAAFQGMIVPLLESPPEAGYGLLALTTVPLVVRRRIPWPVFVFTFVVYLIALGYRPAYSMAIFGPSVALYTIARECPRTEIIFSCVLALFGLWFVGASRITESLIMLERMQCTTWLAVAVVGGTALRSYHKYLGTAEERLWMSELGKEEEAARRVEEERVRIAREIHDITAHSLSAVSIQAAAAEKLVDRDPESAKETIRLIRKTSKSSLEEIRSMVSFLRNEENEGAETAPTQGIDRIPDLCDYARNAGLKVNFDNRGYNEHNVPAYVGVAVYGIAREAVTNTVRHANASQMSITLASDEHSIKLRIEDDGIGPTSTPSPNRGGGHGLTGMEERARALQGTFSAGKGVMGGFSIRVEIPLIEREAHD